MNEIFITSQKEKDGDILYFKQIPFDKISYIHIEGDRLEIFMIGEPEEATVYRDAKIVTAFVEWHARLLSRKEITLYNIEKENNG